MCETESPTTVELLHRGVTYYARKLAGWMDFDPYTRLAQILGQADKPASLTEAHHAYLHTEMIIMRRTTPGYLIRRPLKFNSE